MFNTKNLLVIFISISIAAFLSLVIAEFTPISGLALLFINGFVALVSMQVIQNINLQSLKQSFAARKASKVSAQAKEVSHSSDPNRESGTVKWFDTNKGYGFITRSMGEDIFVHFRSIKGNGYRSLYEGQAVEFIVTKGSKGPQAEDIHIIK